MTESAPPVPGARPGPRPGPGPGPSVLDHASTTPVSDPALAEQLRGLPVAEHAAVFAAEHARLQQQLATIDQL